MSHPFTEAFKATDLIGSGHCFVRVWIDTVDSECLGRRAYSDWLASLPGWRAWFESTRLFWIDFLDSEGVDPLGVIRHLFLNAGSTGSDSSQWLFGLGFVHLGNLTGFYWLYFESALSSVANLLARTTRIPARGLRVSKQIAFWSVFLFFFGLSGLKRGFLRSLLLIFIRRFFSGTGLRTPFFVPVILFVFLDLGLSGISRLSGSLHYAAALLGARVALLEESKGWRFHARLALFSWLACIAFDWVDGRVSIFTPILSFLLLPLLGFVVFPLVMFTFLSQAFFGHFISVGFCYGCVLFDWLIGRVGETLSNSFGAFREISPVESLLGVLCGIFLWGVLKSGAHFFSVSKKTLF